MQSKVIRRKNAKAFQSHHEHFEPHSGSSDTGPRTTTFTPATAPAHHGATSFDFPRQTSVMSGGNVATPQTYSYPARYDALSSEEDDVEDEDEEEQEGEKVPGGELGRLGNLFNDNFLSYLVHCIMLTMVFSGCVFVTLAFMRFLVHLHKIEYEERMRATDSANQLPVIPSKAVVLSVEVLLSLFFASGRTMAEGASVGGALKRQLFLTGIGLLSVFIVLMVVARMTVWSVFGCPFYMQADLTKDTTTLPGCGSHMPVVFLYCCITLLLAFEVLIGEPLSQAIHDMYRRRLVKAFFRNSQDHKFSDIISRPYFLCNVTINNLQRAATGSRTVQPMFLSKLYTGADNVGYRKSADLGIYLSKGMALSGAAIAIDSPNFLLRFTMVLLGIDLGEWFCFRKANAIRRHALQLLNAGPFVILLIGHWYEEWRTWCYLGAASAVVVPLVVMLMWGILLQLTGWNYANFFLHIPLYRRAYQLFGFFSCRNDPYFYLTDGGTFDNLGLYQLLRRGVHEIMVFDAGQDTDYTLKELFEILTTAEEHLGCRVDFERAADVTATGVHHHDMDAHTHEVVTRVVEKLKGTSPKTGRSAASHATGTHFPQPRTPSSGVFGPQRKDVIELIKQQINNDLLKKSESCFIRFSILYPRVRNQPPRRGTIWYVKATLTGKEPAWIKLFALSDRAFPHHSTNNQAFSRTQFDAYRRLGKFAADQVFKDHHDGAHARRREREGHGSTTAREGIP